MDSKKYDHYLNERNGRYEHRAVRYRKACEAMFSSGLNNTHTICDIGAGWTELDYTLRSEYNWMGRYMPIDAALYPIDLNEWRPYRKVDYYVALEILEHLKNPQKTIEKMINTANKGVICSVPNPETVDVLNIDKTHISIIDKEFFLKNNFSISVETFYGGHYSQGQPDAIFATYFTDKN